MKFVYLFFICAARLSADAPPGTLTEIAPGVWFLEGDARGGTGLSNNIIIEMKDYLVVVDANYPTGARKVVETSKKLSPKPIKYVINTHHHPDHSYGNLIFTQIGATTIAHVGDYEEMKRYEPQMWEQVTHERKDVRELNLTAPEPPQLLYTTSPYVITDGTRRVELHHFSFGHTRGDTFVYLPKEKILCTGDAVVNGPYSDPKQANMGNWVNEIRAAEKLGVEHVLPGHGDAGGHEVIDGEIEFFLALYETVQTAYKSGKSLQDVVTVNQNGRAMATTIKLPQKIMDKYTFASEPNMAFWKISRFPTQVMAVYQEIAQGKPYGDLVPHNPSSN